MSFHDQNPWSIENRLLDKHSEDYDPERFLELVDNQRKREKEQRLDLSTAPLRLTLDYCGCSYCSMAKAALEDAWDAHKGRR